MDLPMNAANAREMRDVARYFLLTPRIPMLGAIDACARLSDCLTFFADQFDATGIPFTPSHLTVGLSYVCN